ncbi:MAG: glycerate kinase type-2 family protein [Thermodesulfobacteriota bacterium]
MRQRLQKLRSDALEIFHACLKAADPEEAVKRFVRVRDDELGIGGGPHLRLSYYERILVVGAGKGSAPMGKAIEDLLGDRIKAGLICVKYGHGLPLRTIRIVEAGHPVPDAAGERAAAEMVSLLETAGQRDLVISCISGGGSALLPGPIPPVTLEDKQELVRLLLQVGADIHEMNAVRKHLSFTKGGNLMRAAYPATVINLMLSDVVGDDPDTIASGPFVPDRSTFQDVEEIFSRYDIADRAPAAIMQRVRDGISGAVPETPKHGEEIFQRAHNVIVGSNILSLKAGKVRAEELGYHALILSSSIEGDTTQAALVHAAVAREIEATGNPIPRPACVLSGGETTVVVKGSGLGGRNQEFGLSLVKRAAELPDTVFLSAGTDGTDGPTDAAGALVDCSSLSRAKDLGIDPESYLRDNDSYHFFEKLGDLIITGPTRTNVMDVRIVLVGEGQIREPFRPSKDL